MTLSLQRTVLALLATSALSACATQTEPLRPNFPVRSADAAPQAPPPAAQPAPPRAEDAPLAQANPAPVESRPLDSLPPAAPAPAQAPPPRPEPTYRTVTTRSVTGRVVDADGRATTYEVQKGDSLIAIARKLDTTVDQLREDNDIQGSNIRPGQKLKGPTTSAKAYVVASGDTLFAIARRFSVTADALAEENDLSRNATIRSGQRLRLPEGFRDRGPTVTTTRVAVEGAAPQPTPALRPSPPPERTAAPQPSSSEPAYRTVTTRSVTGRVVEVEGKAVTYEVKKGDSLIEIARELDTTVEQLRKDNNIKGSNIQPGQDLKGPRSTAKAYVAGSGDTLDQIARRFSVTAAALRAENGLSRNATIRSGQRVRLPDGYRDRGPITATSRVPVERPAAPAPTPAPPPAAVTPPPPEPAPVLPSRPQPYTPSPGVRPPPPPVQTRPAPLPAPAQARPAPPPQTTRPAPPPVSQPAPATRPPTSGRPQVTDVAPAAAVSDAQISQLGRGRFIWPLQGDVVSEFGPKPGNQRNDGINIRARAGDAVRAAAAGDVVYAGDQVPGFGNLVLIKHEDGWVTAYGHLSRIDVKMTQKITQGQQVGQAGATGGVPEPQLHFEVRYAPSPLDRARPIDPKLVLPR
ncbi:LysM peptidoglycan-binding domain-containing protein [Phenylobacterium sp.]|uniref:LysM peptidoglycan-binding domain-containing protein n=1 Tax=Phenylobacterium sp. TaxID=1871053 RepID=UPI002D17A4A1|nr:LysM peptidoglycan-binding domain-containing protein [Phenylobacterium sp.]HVI33138.1 LysM peptidoglycan-binding domain-containing protein [Phenylobacterium sp.]